MASLKEKKLLNEAVTGETKRCLAILKKFYEGLMPYPDPEPNNDKLYKECIAELINNSPYIEFHPQLLKRIKS